MVKTLLVAAALVVVATPGAASAQASVAGSWTTEFPLRVRMMNGVESSEGTGHARISLRVKGDSVIGTWQITDVGTVPVPPASTLRGTLANGKVRVESEPSERVMRNPDGEQRVQMRTIYEFVVLGDALDGTQIVESMDGTFQSPSRKFTAAREKK